MFVSFLKSCIYRCACSILSKDTIRKRQWIYTLEKNNYEQPQLPKTFALRLLPRCMSCSRPCPQEMQFAQILFLYSFDPREPLVVVGQSTCRRQRWVQRGQTEQSLREKEKKLTKNSSLIQFWGMKCLDRQWWSYQLGTQPGRQGSKWSCQCLRLLAMLRHCQACM